MELTIDKGPLLAGLAKIQSVVEKRNTLPILSNALLVAAGSELEITATDLEVGLRGAYPANIKAEGRITLHARKIFDIVREMPDGPIQLKLKDNSWVEVIGGRARFNLVGLDAEKFPALPIPEDLKAFKLPGGILADLIDRTAFCASKDEGRINLNGVLLERTELKDEPALRMVATDGHRLAVCDYPLGSNSVDFEGRVLIPRKGVTEIRHLVDEANGDIEIGFSDNSCIVNSGSQTLVVRLIDKEFPDYNQVVPDECTREIEIDVEALRQGVRRVSVLSSDKSKAIKLLFDGDTLTLSSTNTDMEEGVEELGVNYGGAKIAIGFNAQYLLEFMSGLEGDHVSLELNDELSPGVLRPMANPNLLYVIMPMRIAS